VNSKGVTLKRCGCLHPDTNRPLGNACPKLPKPDHGSWYFQCSTRNVLGKAERIRRGGYRSEEAARLACDELLALSREEQAGQSWTVARWLRHWLSTRKRIRPTTKMHYRRDIENFLIPHIGHLIVGDLNSRQLDAAFAQIAATRNRAGQPQTVCTLQHIQATLRAALSRAQRDRLITDNPARGMELPPRERPQPEVWTEARVAEWKATGARPVIAVWTAAQLASFLDYVRGDTLYALWWLIALRGLRRGEAAGLRWVDIDLHEGQLSVVRQRTTAGYDVHEGPPKSAASRRQVALDKHTVQVLRQQRERQQQRRPDASARAWCATTADTCSPARTDCRCIPAISLNACAPDRPRRTSPHPLARPATRRRVARALRGRGHQDHSTPARTCQHPRHRRHLHHRPAAGRA
jgi:integrase